MVADLASGIPTSASHSYAIKASPEGARAVCLAPSLVLFGALLPRLSFRDLGVSCIL
jgi:hypothetical protein